MSRTPEKDTSPEVSPPPSELQSDARKNPAGPDVKTPAAQPGVDTPPPPHSEQNESKPARSPPSARQTHISQPLTKQTMKTRYRRDAERPKSSADDYDLERGSFRDGKHDPHGKCMSGSALKVNDTCTRCCCCCSDNDVDTGNKDRSSVVPLRDGSRNTELQIHSPNEPNDPEDEDNSGSKAEREVEQDPLFFSCTICNVNFKERRHFHRHMMYHLGGHNQVNSEAFICSECGRLFCDSSSLMSHIIIHRDGLQEIKALTNSDAPKRPKISVQHARTHDNLKHYYFCEECDYITLTQPALEAHLQEAHRPRSRKRSNDARLQSEPSLRSGGNTEHIYLHKSSDRSVNSPRFKCRIGCTDNTLPPSLWRVDRQGKLLLQAAERLDVATDLTCVEEDAANNDREAFGSWKQANCPAEAPSLLSARNLKLDQMFCQGGNKDPVSGCLQANPNLPSAPLHNTADSMNGKTSATLSRRLRQRRAGEGGCEGDDTSRAAAGCLESEDVRSPRDTRGFGKRPSRSPGEDGDDGDEDCSDIEQLVIKQENTESAVCDAVPQSPRSSFGSFSSPGAELRPCPYCPALFESGVGLSNHVRGHLHRVGLSYDARHTVSPEQVALRDRRPRVRRRGPCEGRRGRKAVKPEIRGEHMCPLCWAWFHTRTGLSNHVRGHLKRMGSSVSGSRKSPLSVLNQLLQDRQQNPPQTLLLMHMDVPLKVHYDMRRPRPGPDRPVPKQEARVFSERAELQVEERRGSEESNRTLVELLKTKRLTDRDEPESWEETRDQDPDWTQGECDSGQICVQCDDSFPALPAHLRALAHRKRIAFFEGYDYKQKKLKPRPGLKKKILPSLDAEIYTLTCRFCDLVFQGPPSIQEDWIRHLQRHLLHTGLPRSGTPMVEVLGLGLSRQHTE